MLTSILFINCKSDKNDNSQKGKVEVVNEKKIDNSKLLLGIWKTKTLINETQLKKVYAEVLEEGISGEMTINYEYQFIVGNRYNGEGEINLTFNIDNEELPLKFYSKESGNWSLHDNTLVTITEDSKIIAVDDFTKNILAISPETKEIIEPNKGEATSFEIKKINEDTLQVIEADLPGIIFTYIKK
jgi:hypothetical protein